MSLVETAASIQQSERSDTSWVYRVDVLPLSLEVADQISLGPFSEVMTYPIYWFSASEPIDNLMPSIISQLLIDPILQTAQMTTPQKPLSPMAQWLDHSHEFQWQLERQFLPGVTDNLGKTVERNIALVLPKGTALPTIQVASGQAFLIPTSPWDIADILKFAAHQIYNPLIQRLWAIDPHQPSDPTIRFTFPQVTEITSPAVEIIALDLNNEGLMALSQNRNLALTLDEMKAIRHYYELPETKAKRQAKEMPLWPTDIELEIIAQTWSEHCKHKIFAAQIEYLDGTIPEYPVKSTINGLFKTYLVEPTRQLMESKRSDLLSVFKDNAGVLRWNDDYGVCFKAETHNSPSALEPYGGALTGIVGVNRDILGTGLGAKPLFNTDVFCFAHPDKPHLRHPKLLPPESILQGVRKGVEDGGNKSGIPTINGSLFFDARYRAKPLVFCGTGGLLPLQVQDKLGYEKYTAPGDTIVMAGGRVGKDGIHGATFSSEVLHQGSPVSAVQIGDPITQKRLMDFLMEARDQGLLTGVTDNGAGGLSSSVGEMAEITNGASLHLEEVPLKYMGLAPYEIVISESQERMTLSTKDYDALEALAQSYDVEIANIGQFHQDGTLDIWHHGKCVALLDLDFLHHGLPQMQLKAEWLRPKIRAIIAEAPPNPDEVLLDLLKSPNICSREALIRQYDHEVQGRSVIKPLMGQEQSAPCDAAVIQPILGESEGLVVSNGICPQYSDWDTYHMATCAVDEAVRNAVAVGADPKTIALLDNFCWPDPLPSPRNPDAPFKLAQLVRACQALKEMALSYQMPFISGKDSMKNDFDDGVYRISIPPTLLISAMGKIPDIHQAVSMEFKAPGDQIFLLGKTNMHLGGCEYYRLMGWLGAYCPQVDIPLARVLYTKLFDCIQQGWIRSCHDLSEGGLGVALAECVLGSPYGADISMAALHNHSPELRWDDALFSESPSRFVISVTSDHVDAIKGVFQDLPLLPLGKVTEDAQLSIAYEEKCEMKQFRVTSQALKKAWQQPPATCYASGVTP